MDRGFFLTLQAIRRQLGAMPCDFYLVRLIHHQTRKALPGERLWTAPQLLSCPTIRFLRARNREGWDVYFHPCAFDQNAGYILLDLDHAQPQVLDAMRAKGHEPCVLIETSPDHSQAWIRVSFQPLPPAVATAIARQLARLYRGDSGSADWRHLGRLAGFTNQKPKRRSPAGWQPWVKVQHAAACLASNGACLVQAASQRPTPAPAVSPLVPRTDAHTSPQPGAGRDDRCWPACLSADPATQPITAADAATVYQTWLHRLRVPQRFPHPDWSIVDLWIARQLLLLRTPADDVKAILRLASPQFPRRHADPEDYLRRTLSRAAGDIAASTFPPPIRQSPVARI